MTDDRIVEQGVPCPAHTLVQDDRWGGFYHQCELPAGHEGDHQRTLTATEPLARMVWTGTIEVA